MTHYEILRSGVEAWDKWRIENPFVSPDLYGADLNMADLRGADLYGADLRGANLIGANLNMADLRGANLNTANLNTANLRGADLYGADLRGANLYRASLNMANLNMADLKGADLSGADLSGANFACAIGNQKEVRSLLCFERIITYTATHIFVGCQTRSIDEWFNITDDELRKMSPNALERWRKWEPIIKQIITEYPATKQEEA